MDSLKRIIEIVIRRIIVSTTKEDGKSLTFIPHGGCEKDGYNLLNYKSDSALTMFRYIADNHGNKHKYQIAAGENEISRLQKIADEEYPCLDIRFFVHPGLCKSLKTRLRTCKSMSGSKYIFTSEAIPFDYISKEQKVYYLGYYSGNFKNDFIAHYQLHKKLYSRAYTNLFSTSYSFSQVNSLLYNIPLSRFVITGLVRNDNLLLPYNCSQLDNWIKSEVDYDVKHVFLYTPTHRDYEREKGVSERSIMGFDILTKELEKFLADNKAVIIVKIHSAQNIDVLKKEVPKGVLLHKANSEFGLNELLQKADYLITDYTSTYFDYLLLDRPVLFNFYDFDIYKKTRGFNYDPIDSIIAGEIFIDQESMLEKMKQVMKEDHYKWKRKFVRDLIFKYQDSNAAQRVYEYIFNA